jgi:uncharacterized protein
MNLSDELDRLCRLHQQGGLTDDEFTVAKAAVIRDEHALMASLASDRDVAHWAILLHLSQLLVYVVPPFGLVAPFVIWQFKKEDMPAIDEHGRNVANWVLSALIYTVAAALLCVVVVGVPLLFALLAASVVFPIIGAFKASSGRAWRYPLSINFFRAGEWI